MGDIYYFYIRFLFEVIILYNNGIIFYCGWKGVIKNLFFKKEKNWLDVLFICLIGLVFIL